MIAWVELTTKEGKHLRDFYSQVLGVGTAGFDMGGYEDHNVPGESPEFGICDPRSSDGVLPPGWIVYLRVADLEAALDKTRSLGGTVLSGPRHTKGYGTHAVIRDPTGNTTALYEQDEGDSA